MGTAAKISNKGLTVFLNFLGAYSLKYTAIVSPTGKATDTAITVVSNVPEISGIIPKCLLANKGVHWSSVRKSTIETSSKKVKLSDKSTQIIPNVVSMVIAALLLSRNSTIFSFVFIFILK